MIRQFQTDRLLDERNSLILKKIKVSNGQGNIKYEPSRLTQNDRSDVSNLLGAYDSMALSVLEGITEENLMKAEFDLAVADLVDYFLPMGSKKTKLYTKEEAEEFFPCLIKLYKRWHSS